MRTILISGYNGLVGKGLIEELKKDSSLELVGIGRSENKNVNVINIDLSTEWNESVLPSKADCIIHLAQSEKFREFPEAAFDVFNVNTVSTLKLLEYGRKAGVKKFIYASSGGVYGNSDVGFNEEDPLVNRKDIGFYLGSKFCSEILADNYASYFDVITLRFFFVYGKEQKPSMLIPRLLNNILQGNEIALQGNDGIKINPIHVSDAAKAVIKCLEIKGSHKINIGGPDVLSLREICNIMAEKTGKAPKLTVHQNEAKHLFSDISKMEKLLVKPVIRFSDGINELVKKYE